MTDILDQLVEREAHIEALQQAARRMNPLSAEAIQQIAEDGRNCDECGEPIPKARLLAQPFARCCVDCQALLEKTNKRK